MGSDHTILGYVGAVAHHTNRTVFIPNGGRLRLASVGRLTIGGEIKGEAVGGLDYPTNTWIDARTTTSWTGTIVIGPGEGRMNDVGRICVGGHLEVTSGVTRVASSTAWGTGDSTAMVVVNGNNSAYNDAKGYLVVNGGTLTSAQSERYMIARQYGQVEVTNGGSINMSGITYLNGLSSPATTTIANGGEIKVANFQLANSTTSILNLNSGGMLVTPKLWIHSAGTATINFDGGGIRYTGTKQYLTRDGSAGNLTDWANVTLLVKEGGAVFDTTDHLYLDLPLTSGAVHDGGFIKRGRSDKALVIEVATTLNGPTRVESGTVQCRVDNALAPSTLILTNGSIAAFCKYDSGYTRTVQTLNRIEGDGMLEYCDSLHVTNSLAPSVNGTLTFNYRCDISGDLEICGDANGCGKLEFVRGTTDISRLTLRVADFAAFDTEKGRSRNGTTSYQILSVRNGAGYSGEFKLPAEWPNNWGVKYTPNGAYLRYKTGTILVIQ